MAFTEGYQLVHPHTNELVAVFQGYTESGVEVWKIDEELVRCTFEGFTDDGWTRWSQPEEYFEEHTRKKVKE